MLNLYNLLNYAGRLSYVNPTHFTSKGAFPIIRIVSLDTFYSLQVDLDGDSSISAASVFGKV